MNTQKTSKIIVISFCLIIFFTSFLLHWWPVVHKGYPPSVIAETLVLARNLAKTGEYKIESQQNIILSTSLIKAQGTESDLGNKLTAQIYGWIFKKASFNLDLPIYISLFLFSLSSVFLFFLMLKLFNLRMALIFAVVDIFLPVTTLGAIMPGFYEWAMLFFVIALMIYLWPARKEAKKPKKEIRPPNPRLFLASIFFALSALARNAFLLPFPLFLIFDFYQNRSFKRIALFILPFFILVSGYFVLDYVNGAPNAYLNPISSPSLSRFGHLFNDPYVYHFEKEEFLKTQGEDPYRLNFKNYISDFWKSVKFYPTEFFRLITIGGPLIILFLLGGMVYLYKEKRGLAILFIIWGIGLYLILIALRLQNWDHFLEIRFPAAVLTSLGIYCLFDYINFSDWRPGNKNMAIILVAIGLIFHFIEANKWMLHEEYNTSGVDKVIAISEAIKKENINTKNVIAVPVNPYLLNYYTNKNIIYFHTETVEKLSKEKRLEWAFEKFGVDYFAGYSQELTKLISEQAQVKNVPVLNN